jgi:fluoroquinolone resistance protein
MEKAFTEAMDFEAVDFGEKPLPPGDYERCHFLNCNFSGTVLAGILFIDCRFTGCNFANANPAQAAFRDVQFKDCKLLGLHFESCNHFLFAAGFENCVMDLCNFYKMKLKQTVFKNTSLHEADFTQADCSAAVFHHCDLHRAVFEHTVLEKADFRTAFNYAFDPDLNKIKKAKFAMPGVAALLSKYDIIIE